MIKSLVLGAGGFIGSHLVTRLKKEGHFVRGIDLKYPEFSQTDADEFIIADLRDSHLCAEYITEDFDEVYQLAADMGGAGYLFSGENDFNVMHNSGMINLNVADCSIKQRIKKVFFSSSACIYPQTNQVDPDNPNCVENSAFPADPDSEYGWEKIFAERMYLSALRNYNLNVRIARFHNVYGPLGTWNSGKEKAPAALCRKVAESDATGEVEIWGDGNQTRSFLYIDDCVDGVRLLMNSDFEGPVNIGSEEMVTINSLGEMILSYAGKNAKIKHVDGPIGVMGRNSENTLVKEKIGWEPKIGLQEGLGRTYDWIVDQVNKKTTTLESVQHKGE
ncbi:MAG: NAD-dependent epimerase/dehydratase family protein [Crocinitomicaceae bacterium]|nr:NAD-dependent epimerase/dehydratase family protein [Crocinitomicaceae bacterium]